MQFGSADHSEDHSEGHLVRSSSPDRLVPQAHSAGEPTHPPPTPCEKTIFSKFGANIQICGAKIQILDPKSINFCTTENLLLCKRKSPNSTRLSPTHPPLGLSKKSKCIPLDVFSTFWFLNLGILYVEVLFKSHTEDPPRGFPFPKIGFDKIGGEHPINCELLLT